MRPEAPAEAYRPTLGRTVSWPLLAAVPGRMDSVMRREPAATPEMQVVSVLLVEDDDVDVLAFKEALRERKIANPVTVAHDGVEALEFLRGSNGRSPIPQPCVVVLDLNMPRMGGLEFIKEIRADRQFRKLIIFVLTTSCDDRDLAAAYDENVAGYISKDAVGPDFMNLLDMLSAFWRVVCLPQCR